MQVSFIKRRLYNSNYVISRSNAEQKTMGQRVKHVGREEELCMYSCAYVLRRLCSSSLLQQFLRKVCLLTQVSYDTKHIRLWEGYKDEFPDLLQPKYRKLGNWEKPSHIQRFSIGTHSAFIWYKFWYNPPRPPNIRGNSTTKVKYKKGKMRTRELLF